MKKLMINFWVEVNEKGEKHPLRDRLGAVIYFSSVGRAMDFLKVKDLKGKVICIGTGECGKKIPCSAKGGGPCFDCPLGCQKKPGSIIVKYGKSRYCVTPVKTGEGRFATGYIIGTKGGKSVKNEERRRNIINEAITKGVIK
jgi:hypothetical protein